MFPRYFAIHDFVTARPSGRYLAPRSSAGSSGVLFKSNFLQPVTPLSLFAMAKPSGTRPLHASGPSACAKNGQPVTGLAIMSICRRCYMFNKAAAQSSSVNISLQIRLINGQSECHIRSIEIQRSLSIYFQLFQYRADHPNKG